MQARFGVHGAAEALWDLGPIHKCPVGPGPLYINMRWAPMGPYVALSCLGPYIKYMHLKLYRVRAGHWMSDIFLLSRTP